MADTAARLAISARRNEVARFTITVTGIDMTGVPMAMQIRPSRDVPGAPLIALATVTTLAAEGLKFDSVTVTDGVPTSVIKGRINASTMTDATKVPYSGEVGDNTVLAYAMQWTLGGDAQTRLYGDFIVVGSAFGSDGAPTDRPPSYGSPQISAGGSSGASLSFGDQIIQVSIDAAEIVGALTARAEAASAAAVASAAQLAIGRRGEYNLVDPAAPMVTGGINSAGDFVSSTSYRSIIIKVEPGQSIVMFNAAQQYTAQYSAAFFSSSPAGTGNKIATFAGVSKTNSAGQNYRVGVVPAGAAYLSFNVQFSGAAIAWFVAVDTVFNGVVAFSPIIVSLGGVSLADTFIRSKFLELVGATEGYANLHDKTTDVPNRYINATGARTAGPGDWYVASIGPLTPGVTYAIRLGSQGWGQYEVGVWGNGAVYEDQPTPGTLATFVGTSDPLVRTFTVPAGKDRLFFNVAVNGNDHRDALTVQTGLSLAASTAFALAVTKIAGFLIKDKLAHERIGGLLSGAQTPADPRFYQKTVVCNGDSITSTEVLQGSYVPPLAGVLQCNAINRGSSGAQAGRLVALMTDQPDRQGSVTPLNPSYVGLAAVTIMIGTNHAQQSVAALGTLASIPSGTVQQFIAGGGTAAAYWAQFANNFYGNLSLCLEYVRWKNATVPIYIITPIANQFTDMIFIAKALEEISDFYSCNFIDLNRHGGLDRKRIGYVGAGGAWVPGTTYDGTTGLRRRYR